jgi:hypothetical protein
MNKLIEQLNDDLSYAEATLREIVESSRDWLDSEIKESGEEFIRGVQRRIINRHPSMGWIIDSLEF